MAGCVSFRLIREALRNLRPRTRKIALFWLVVVVIIDAAFAVKDGNLWLATMISVAILFIEAVEIGLEVRNYIDNRPQPTEESWGRTLADDMAQGCPYSAEPAPPDKAADTAAEAIISGADALTSAADAAGGAALTGEVAAEVGESLAEAAGEAASEIVGGIISGS